MSSSPASGKADPSPGRGIVGQSLPFNCQTTVKAAALAALISGPNQPRELARAAASAPLVQRVNVHSSVLARLPTAQTPVYDISIPGARPQALSRVPEGTQSVTWSAPLFLGESLMVKIGTKSSTRVSSSALVCGTGTKSDAFTS